MYKSGITIILRSINILSAAGVVGPLAASAMIYKKSLSDLLFCKCNNITLALILFALSDVMTFSTAAGMNMSHSSYINPSPSYFFAPGKPTIVPLVTRQSSKAYTTF